MAGTRYYLVTIHDTGNITDDARNIHVILTSTDHILPRERVEVEPYEAIWRRVRAIAGSSDGYEPSGDSGLRD